MIGQHDHLHAGLFCVGEHFRPGAARVGRIFRMRVNDRLVVVQSGQCRQRFSSLLNPLSVVVGSLEMGTLQALQGTQLARGKIRLRDQRKAKR